MLSCSNRPPPWPRWCQNQNIKIHLCQLWAELEENDAASDVDGGSPNHHAMQLLCRRVRPGRHRQHCLRKHHHDDGHHRWRYLYITIKWITLLWCWRGWPCPPSGWRGGRPGSGFPRLSRRLNLGMMMIRRRIRPMMVVMMMIVVNGDECSEFQLLSCWLNLSTRSCHSM